MSLVQQVAQLKPIAPEVLHKMQQEIMALDSVVDWTQAYSEYQTGGWKTLSLLNHSSDPRDTQIQDCQAVETSLLGKLPHTRGFLAGLGVRIMWARLAKLEPNGFLWEHRDYAELQSVERLRLHIPIITNLGAALIINGKRVQMALGHIWKLDPAERHAACNLGRESRIHIIIDCYGDEALDNLISSESLCSSHVRDLPMICAETLLQYTEQSVQLARLGYHTSAETMLLKLFHKYDLAEGVSYDLVTRLYHAIGDDCSKESWKEKKRKFLDMQN